MATSYYFGHKCVYDWGQKEWLYADNGKSVISEKRKCPRCGEFQTDKGHDPCVANTPGVSSICCGHGVEKPYKVKINV